MSKIYILHGQPITVEPENEETFKKTFPKAVLKSDEPGKSIGTSQSQNNQQTDTVFNLEGGSLESLKTNFDNIENEINKGNYENKLSNLNNAIEKSEYGQQKNALINQYNNILKEYEDKISAQNAAAKEYNEAIKNLGKQKTPEEAKEIVDSNSNVKNFIIG